MRLLAWIVRLFRDEPIVLSPDPPVMDGPLPEAAFAALRAAVWSPEARITVEFLSGTPIWEDERHDKFVMACMEGHCDRWHDPFHYRLFLITGQKNELVDYDRCEQSWNLIAANCPNWPGLRADRTTSQIRERIERILAEVMASF